MTIVVRISISAEAFEAIARTLPLGSVAVEPEVDAKGERAVWLEEVWVDRLAALRGPGESYSDVIFGLVRGVRRALRKDVVAACDHGYPLRDEQHASWRYRTGRL